MTVIGAPMISRGTKGMDGIAASGTTTAVIINSLMTRLMAIELLKYPSSRSKRKLQTGQRSYILKGLRKARPLPQTGQRSKSPRLRNVRNLDIPLLLYSFLYN